MPKASVQSLAILAVALLVCACGEGLVVGSSAESFGQVEIGAARGVTAERVASGLNNPSGLAFKADGTVTISDSGNGRIVEVRGGEVATIVDGFATEFWKLEPDRFKLGPLSHLWLPDGTLVVTDSGLPDGKDRLLYLPPGASSASEGRASPSIPKTSDDKKDLGEGNFTGLSLDPSGKTIWVAGQGADSRSWTLSSEVATAGLSPVFSADLNGITTNSPMDTAPDGQGGVFVLYSGAGGQEDGLIVRWDVKTQKPTGQWALPGLVDPMGMAWDARTETFLVVDNNWALTHVNHGKLARVRLKENGQADVEILANRLQGPVACRFGPDGALYVACLGKAIDADHGEVLVIRGL